VLDNVMWRCLSGPHARFAVGDGDARRYAPGFSPILGFADPERPDFGGLARHCQAGERFYCDIWSGPPPPGWTIEKQSTMFKMVWEGGVPEAGAPDAVPLRPEHTPQAVALAVLTNPGPFGPRTPELGEHLGYFEGGRLLAMAGERLQAGALHEVSAVCTHPDARGRGFATRLTLELVRRQRLRGETPFLHVMSQNAGARALYERLGFRPYRETTVRVVARL
jgi:ribosomal protein S18 acetylase RimI-like enzyme